MQTIVYNICNAIFVYNPVLLNHDDDEQVVGLVVVSSLIGRQPNQETAIFSLLTAASSSPMYQCLTMWERTGLALTVRPSHLLSPATTDPLRVNHSFVLTKMKSS